VLSTLETDYSLLDDTMKNQIFEVAAWTSSKKAEKKHLLDNVLNSIRKRELGLLSESYIKEMQIKSIRAAYSQLFSEFNQL